METRSRLSPVSVVHTMAGRVRLRVGWLEGDARSAEGVVKYLERHAGVRGARVNAACGAVVVRYDAARTSPAEIRRALRKPLPRTASELLSAPEPAWRSYRVSALISVVLGGLGLGLALFGAAPPLSFAAVCVSTVPILRRAGADLRERKLSADVLDALAVVIMLAQRSLLPAALSSFLIAAGEYIRALTARRSRRALDELIRSTEHYAWVIRGERKQRVLADTVLVGEIVAVSPGERIAVDGKVIDGEAMVDEKVLTGEASQVHKRVGDTVYAATILTDGELSVFTERTGRQTRAHRIVELLESAPAHETAIGNYASRFADRFVLPILLLGVGILALTGDVRRMLSVIVFDFATGVRISVPTTVLAGMSAAVRRNVLIKGGRAIEQLARVDTMVFDKTGTLTSGLPAVTEIRAFTAEIGEREMLGLAASAEHRLSHPAAAAIVREAEKRGVAFPERGASRYFVGSGVEAEIGGSVVLVGNANLLRERAIAFPDHRCAATDPSATCEASTVYVACDGVALGSISYADVARSEAREAMRSLRRLGITQLVMATGDRRAVAEELASELKLDRVEAEIFPDRKMEIVRELQAAGRVVAVVGDGINDSPALAYADVSISLSGGSDVARETADVILHDDLFGIVEAIGIARDVMRIIREDLMIVGVFNGVGALGAVTGLVGPTVATALNNGSAVLAAFNSLRPVLAMPSATR